jgi:hypothetical protein
VRSTSLSPQSQLSNPCATLFTSESSRDHLPASNYLSYSGASHPGPSFCANPATAPCWRKPPAADGWGPAVRREKRRWALGSVCCGARTGASTPLLAGRNGAAEQRSGSPRLFSAAASLRAAAVLVAAPLWDTPRKTSPAPTAFDGRPAFAPAGNPPWRFCAIGRPAAGLPAQIKN